MDLRCQFMQSDGGLVDFSRFSGLRAILSGSAGGVVGYSRTSYDAKDGTPLIGFDMGGTSTDVSRYAGRYEHVFETTTTGVTIQSPPSWTSTPSRPGTGRSCSGRTVCSRLGRRVPARIQVRLLLERGGALTITDANLFLGRLLPGYFPQDLWPN